MITPEKPISDAELQVLKTLWDSGPATVRDVISRLSRKKRPWAYTTILTLLGRLRDKGYVAQEPADPPAPHRFRALISRDQLLKNRLRELSDRLCNGAASPLVHALIENPRLSASDITALRDLLARLSKKE